MIGQPNELSVLVMIYLSDISAAQFVCMNVCLPPPGEFLDVMMTLVILTFSPRSTSHQDGFLAYEIAHVLGL